MIVIRHKGNFKKTEEFLRRSANRDLRPILEKYAKKGVLALSSATPINSGLTASSWDYLIEIKNSQFSIIWTNSNIVNGVPIAIILQYGHAARDGSYVQGYDYINPALRPVFDAMVDELWKEVTRQ